MKKNLVTNLVTPSPEWWDAAIHGMRNAFKSWDKGDSAVCGSGNCEKCTEHEFCLAGDDPRVLPYFVLGKNDRALLMSLTAAGDPSHRKVLRQLPVIMDISAPLLFWKQLDTYKVGTTANSESTMHTITKYPFTLDDFDIQKDDYPFSPETVMENTIVQLNTWRDIYLGTHDIRYWHLLNDMLPQSYIQTRTWSANYEVLLTIIKNRLGHKIPIWDELITYWLKNIDMLLELAVAAGLVEVKGDTVCYQDQKDPDIYHGLFEVD